MDELTAILKDEKIADEWKGDSIRQALENGADPNAANGYALRMCAVRGLADAARILCEAGADPNVNDGAAAKMAVRYNHPEVLEVLRNAGADMGPAMEYARARVSDNNAPAPENAAAAARDIANTKNIIAGFGGEKARDDKERGGNAPKSAALNRAADIILAKPKEIDAIEKPRDDKGSALDKAADKIKSKIASENLFRQKMSETENN
ncbi:MAG: ankyrin repeat domain-containing protein [Rickettsiales bacterium]|jgi:hypothetical protein|nr:ankyrin repeat domain-containing protein [Rickettsiales bacterium]